MGQISLKNVVLPWEAKRHIHADSVEREVTLFADELRIRSEYFADTNTLFAYLHPSASLERLSVVGKMYALVWFLDDYWDGNLPPDTLIAAGIRYENRFSVIKEIANLIKTGANGQNHSPLLRGFQLVWSEFSQTAPKKWLIEFAQTVVDSLITSNESEISAEVIKSFDDYLEYRDKDAGGIYTCLLMEYANDIFLPPEIRHDPLVAELRILSIRVGGLGNDLVSYHKEQLQHEEGFNAITFLIEKQDVTLESAVNTVIDKQRSLIQEFVRLEDKLADHFPDTHPAYDYVEGLKEIMSGTWHWELTSMRYRTENALFPSLDKKLKQI